MKWTVKLQWLLPGLVLPLAIGCSGNSSTSSTEEPSPTTSVAVAANVVCDAADTIRTYWDVDPVQAQESLERLGEAIPDLADDVQLQLDTIQALQAISTDDTTSSLKVLEAGQAQRRIDEQVVSNCGAPIWGLS